MSIRHVVRMAAILFGLAMLLFLPGRFAEKARLQEPTATIDPAVLDALQRDAEVEVLIVLKLPAIPLAEAKLADVRQNTAERQTRVLAVLTASDFTLIHQFKFAAVLFGRVTESGLEKLVSHPDVSGIGINGTVSGDGLEALPQ